MDNKGKGVIAYLFSWLGGIIVMFGFKDNDRKTVFHAAQSIVIGGAYSIVSIGIGFINVILALAIGFGIPFVSWIIGVLYLVLMILGIVKVLNDEDDPKLPVLGDLTEKLFEKQINAAPDTYVKPTVARFDPNTGEPITTPATQPAVTPKFDPNTGEPLDKKEDTPEEKTEE